MYRVMYWDNQFEKGEFPKDEETYLKIQTHSVHENLNIAKKTCQQLGHTGENDSMLTGYPPIAFVTNDSREVVYNPRFKKE